MPESRDKRESHAEPPSPAAESRDHRGAADQQPQQVQVDDSRAVAAYANFCRVTGNPEELIVDFGLNLQAAGVPAQPIPINLRVIVNFYTAKRLLHALQMSIQRHEATFGVLETDVRRRVRPRPQGQLPGEPRRSPAGP